MTWHRRKWREPDSIRTRVLLGLLALGGVCLAVLAFLLQPAVVALFDRQEAQQTERDTRRAATYLQSQVTDLARLAINWAVWDDAYTYVQTGRRAFETSNFVPGTYQSMDLNLLAYVALDGRVISRRGYDLQRRQESPPSDRLLGAVVKPGTLAALDRPGTHREGFVYLPATAGQPGETWLVALRPVTHSDERGPVRGVILMARQITPRVVTMYRQNLQLTLDLIPQPGTSALSEGSGVTVHVQDRHSIQGRTVLNDLNGQPSLLLRVTDDRGTHLIGVSTALAVLLAVGTVMLLFTLLTAYLLETQVLSRLAVYQRVVRHLNDQPVTTLLSVPAERRERLPVRGQDELDHLGRAFNGFLDEIDSGRERLVWQAQHDDLTGLPNRQLFSERVMMRLEQGLPLSVALIDLNHFKNVNDTLGHHVGDEVLQAVAGRLARRLSAQGVVARLGGDEFAVLLPQGPQVAARTLLPVLQALTTPIATGAGEVRLSGSAGLTGLGVAARSGMVGQDAWVTLLREADVAMYEAKRTGLPIVPFDPALLASVEERIRLEHALETAIERQELRLVYQVIVALDEARPGVSPVVANVEALLRWNSPELGEVAPFAFIPLAEENGRIHALGTWVLDAALEFARRQPGLRVAVNVSAAQLGDDDLVTTVLNALQRSGVQPSQLELEVTETAVLRDLAGATERLAQLHAHGVWITLDDFGTGHSSLAVLCSLPIQKVKLDRFFLKTSLHDPRSEAVLRAMLAMARDLNLAVVAEGIETPEQCEALRRLGFRLGQGYLFGQPLEEAEALKLPVPAPRPG